MLTGGPQLADVGRAAGVRIPAGGTRHQVVVTEPHPDLAPDRLPMVFDVTAGIYWRPEEGGVLWGMSNPDGAAGRGDASSTTTTSPLMRARVAELVPVTGELGLRKQLGGDHRLHARPPADPRPGARARTARSPAPWSPPPAATG